jgi:Na+:H+ antiporter, NhaA family
MLLSAVTAGLLMWLLNRRGVTRPDVYIVIGLFMWVFVLKSGVHATLAGVITALAIPMRDAKGHSPVISLEHGLHPWVAFLVLPLFAFSNAGVALQGVTADVLFSPVPMGIVLGLLVGKAVGVFGTTMMMIKLGLAQPPSAASVRQILGVSILCGIGFTMSLFIGGLAFAGLDPVYTTQLKIGVLSGSVICGLLGTLLLLQKR